ncbi:MAG: carbohydrate-binding family 9-like protein [Terrimicrobiaceae bacterium]
MTTAACGGRGRRNESFVMALLFRPSSRAVPIISCALLIFCVPPGQVFCVEPPPPRAEARYVEIGPKIDGRLDDGAWSKALPIKALGGETLFLWSQEGVYVAFRALEKSPVMGAAAEGESLHEEDVFEIFLDQKGDHRQFYEVQIDPAGRLFLKNHILTAEPRLTTEGRLQQGFVQSELWRYVILPPEGLQSASRLNPETGEWTVELFLPAALVNSRKEGAPLAPVSWRIHLVRNEWDKARDVPDRTLISTSWAPVLEKHAHISPTRMGWLELRERD